MTDSISIDSTALEERLARSNRKAGYWPLTNLAYMSTSAKLQVGVTVKVFLEHGDRQEVWVGKVTKRAKRWCEMCLWGSGKPFRVPFGNHALKRAGVVPEFRHAEYRAVCERQRRGLPAWSSVDAIPALAKPTIELDDDMVARVEAFAEAKGLTVEAGLELLIDVGLRRLKALRKWVASSRQKASQQNVPMCIPPVA